MNRSEQRKQRQVIKEDSLEDFKETLGKEVQLELKGSGQEHP